MNDDLIERYPLKAPAALAAVCQLLRTEIDRALPAAAAKIWHAMPVWFVGENPVVGYKLASRYVNLLSWNGQSFEDPVLTAAGSFRAAQIRITEVSGIDRAALRRWLKRAGTDVFDLRAHRAAHRGTPRRSARSGSKA